jgi:uncharacterized tellurite resistance protein B-like protein
LDIPEIIYKPENLTFIKTFLIKFGYTNKRILFRYKNCLVLKHKKMNFSDFITHNGKRVNKEAFINLVQVSRTDGKINKEELELLHKEGKKFGLTDPEIDKLIHSEKNHNYHPPYSLDEKFEHLYNIAEMILADDVVKEKELKMIRRFAIEAGFSDDVIEWLPDLLLEGVRKGEDEENLLHQFKKKLRG